MPSTKRTLVNFILDKSGSMSAVRESTISGFNEYVTTLKKDKKNQYDFSLVLFDTQITSKYVNTPINKVDELDNKSYNPDGMTALYDAVCQTINDVKKTATKNQKVLTVIMTDGEENSSKEYTQKQLKEKITELEKDGNWTFVFLGANQDSWVNAQKFGISAMNTSNFLATDAGIAKSMQVLASNTSSFASNNVSNTSTFFSAKDQVNLGGESVDNVSQHFSALGKKSWEARKRKLQSDDTNDDSI